MADAWINSEFILRRVRTSISLSWLVLRRVGDDYFCVPVDTDPFVGTCDVLSREVYVARCGMGVWLSEDFLLANAFFVQYESMEFASSCRSMLADMVRGRFPVGRETTDADGNYRRHMRQVAGIVNRIVSLEGRNEVSGRVDS